MQARCALGASVYAILSLSGSSAFGQTTIEARTDKPPGTYSPGDVAVVEYYLTNLHPPNPDLPLILNWTLDFIGNNPEDAALRYGDFTQTFPARLPPGAPPYREFWNLQFGPLFPASTANGPNFPIYVEDPLPPSGGTIGPDNRGSSTAMPPAVGPGWSVFVGDRFVVLLDSNQQLLDEVLLAEINVHIDATGADASNTVLGGVGPLAQLQWVTELDFSLGPFGGGTALASLVAGGAIGEALVSKPLVPEPATALLLLAGTAAVVRRRRVRADTTPRIGASFQVRGRLPADASPASAVRTVRAGPRIPDPVDHNHVLLPTELLPPPSAYSTADAPCRPESSVSGAGLTAACGASRDRARSHAAACNPRGIPIDPPRLVSKCSDLARRARRRSRGRVHAGSGRPESTSHLELVAGRQSGLVRTLTLVKRPGIGKPPHALMPDDPFLVLESQKQRCQPVPPQPGVPADASHRGWALGQEGQ